MDNVFFFDPVPKSKMPWVIAAIDVALVPLKKIDIFKDAIPSKIFESFAMKKPILLGVDGEAKDLFVKDSNCAVYFEPENSKAVTDAVLQLYVIDYTLDICF